MMKDTIKSILSDLSKHIILTHEEDDILVEFVKNILQDNKVLKENCNKLIEENAILKDSKDGQILYYKYKIKSLEDYINEHIPNE